MIPTSSKRTVNSCQRCRARKIRCGRERPRCQNCLRSNHLCRYVEASPAASHTTDERHEDLTRRVSRLEAVVAQLAGRPVNEVLQEPEPRPRARESPVAAIGMVDNEPRLGLGSYWKQLAAQVSFRKARSSISVAHHRPDRNSIQTSQRCSMVAKTGRRSPPDHPRPIDRSIRSLPLTPNFAHMIIYPHCRMLSDCIPFSASASIRSCASFTSRRLQRKFRIIIGNLTGRRG
ncbi:hypothetical protein BDV25DRAFT_148943 [Aspergillus avenaceus]|uniref:Zn(2)-C6 fungal-type domain-containing protein n=1 Tax=Aspergillus avenaceus TaxID=36643 RepID=A0A5N6U4V9_ASPAV|nr:hypothetical protein BDV25DRAFT_148943 [Aspergillus avenaceus]